MHLGIAAGVPQCILTSLPAGSATALCCKSSVACPLHINSVRACWLPTCAQGMPPTAWEVGFVKSLAQDLGGEQLLQAAAVPTHGASWADLARLARTSIICVGDHLGLPGRWVDEAGEGCFKAFADDHMRARNGL